MQTDVTNIFRQKARAFVVKLGGWLVGLPRFHKRAVLVTIDFFVLAFAMWLAMSFRLAEFYVPPDLPFLLMLAAAPCIGVATFAWFGLYRLVTRYIGNKGTTAIAVCVGLSVLIWALAIVLSEFKGVPRTVLVLYGIF